ncbi:MAG: hypothetical protein LW630_02940 [Saprospiraceae bacterium]|nr:hypothetical protein [Saprospiraceae bacterium]
METVSMVVRMRIYNTSERKIDSDKVFYELVKPVHEKYGAKFLGRYIDAKGRYVVLWAYPSEHALNEIQKLVAEDEDTIKHAEIRKNSGLHGVDFEEFILESTEPS